MSGSFVAYCDLVISFVGSRYMDLTVHVVRV